ncbi:type II toxin-antitoxin system VapC family toxin [Zavarzinia compransoris]|uniref:type II toxin-antitoxin system VapC family toxin n=1 Tax=Zavarzinia marina TaxID=2911065 RepID=UPI001F46A625|nr:type II toxin-antitoxin system VapC family toxin [Zavarzinia marina]MCF4166908.1 type II toxin-antitoxin system VapC family toxin [Zavarzinia marina]
MIVLDTNVVSEPMRLDGDPAVRAWLDAQAAETLYLTSVSLAELLVGIGRLPQGRRRDGLDRALAALLDRLFGDRILPFDAAAARIFADIQEDCRMKGRAIAFADGQIAAIARSHGFSVATRDTAPFEAAGVPVINPWG